MKTNAKCLILSAGMLVLAGLLLVVQAVGATPGDAPAQPEGLANPVFSYQGILTDHNGVPITATVTMTFTLYSVPSSGTALWEEVQTVAVSNGLFHVVLGSVVPITAREDVTDGLYLGITVDGEELVPREQVTSVFFATDAWRVSGAGNRIMAEGGVNPDEAHVRLYSKNGVYVFIDTDHNASDQVFQVRRDKDDFTSTAVFTVQEDGYIDATGALNMNGNTIVNCGALTEANLQTPEERAAGGIDRFEEGDVLCWGIDRLEKCSAANDRLVQAVADRSGRPIVIGAELVKVLGPVKRGDILVASWVPGYAMVNDDPVPGSVIAQALEDFGGERGLIAAMIRKF
ncbi:MAG: hypothetical protein JXM73_17580 [Anaerolineae bacterium]|nr:hypothetical protein [Anaerolineae bacterium]